MSKIQRLEIRITPEGWTREAHEMTVRVIAHGKEYAMREMCQLGDLDSFFDYLFERAKVEIRKCMLKN